MTGSVHTFKLRQVLDRLWNDLESKRRTHPDAGLLTTEVHLAAPEGALRLALGRDGDRHLLVPVPAGTGTTEDTRSAGVRLARRELVFGTTTVVFVDLECRRTDLSSVFTGLTADICERISSAHEDPAASVANALQEWRALLGLDRKPWTATLVAGLHGELVVLERALSIDRTAVRLWGGPAGAPHDFHSVHHALEVKTTTGLTGRVVRVHGVGQLERPHGGDLTLTWLRMVASTAGVTLAERIHTCLSAANDQRTLVRELDRLDLPATTDPLMSETRFELIEERWFEVDDDFPRLTPDQFVTAAVPAGVGAVEYSVDLDVVGAWEASGATSLDMLVNDR